jgi:hypothetical protein
VSQVARQEASGPGALAEEWTAERLRKQSRKPTKQQSNVTISSLGPKQD